MTTVKASLAQHPLLWFFVLTLGPIAVAQSELTTLLYLCAAGPIAVLACWAGAPNEPDLRKNDLRPLSFVAVAAVATLLAAADFGSFGWPGYVGVGVACGFTVSCLWSPSPAIRDLVRPLLRWRLPWTTYAFALLALPTLAVTVIIASRLLPARTSSDQLLRPFGGQMWHRAAKAFACNLVLMVPFVVGWYGLVTRRLLARHSPLLVSVLLGIPLAAAFALPLWPDKTQLASMVASEVSQAIVAVWLFGKARGSLPPLLLLTAAGNLAGYAIFWAGLGFGGFETFQLAVALVQCLLALCLIVGWRMWRGPTGKAQDAVVQTT